MSETLSPWVRASERQPAAGRLVYARLPRVPGRPFIDNAPLSSQAEWLDLDGVDRLAAENDRLREELVNEREISGARIASLEAERDELSRQLEHEKKCREYWKGHAARWHRQNSNMARERDDLREELANARKSNNPAELTFGELVRMAVRDQSFDPEA